MDGKLKTLGGRVAHIKRRLTDRADALAKRLDDIERTGVEIFEKQEAFVTSMERDVAGMEAELRELTNGADFLSDSDGQNSGAPSNPSDKR